MAQNSELTTDGTSKAQPLAGSIRSVGSLVPNVDVAKAGSWVICPV